MGFTGVLVRRNSGQRFGEEEAGPTGHGKVGGFSVSHLPIVPCLRPASCQLFSIISLLGKGSSTGEPRFEKASSIKETSLKVRWGVISHISKEFLCIKRLRGREPVIAHTPEYGHPWGQPGHIAPAAFARSYQLIFPPVS